MNKSRIASIVINAGEILIGIILLIIGLVVTIFMETIGDTLMDKKRMVHIGKSAGRILLAVVGVIAAFFLVTVFLTHIFPTTWG